MNGKTTLERAFELARSGQYENTTDNRKALQSERYDLRQMAAVPSPSNSETR